MAEWSIALDCKSGAFGLRRFKSFSPHSLGIRDEKSSLFLMFTRVISGSNCSNSPNRLNQGKIEEVK